MIDGHNQPPVVPREAKPVWLVVAEGEAGIHEVAGPLSNPRIIEYYKATNLGGKPEDSSTPWCAAFVSWVLEMSGYKSTRRANARSYLDYGMVLEEPKVGCIAVLEAVDRGPAAGHVSFYLGDHAGEQIWLFGGNQGNRVSPALYGKGRLIGYRWPKETDRKK